MTPTALQMPYRQETATRVGPKLFRKQVLPVGSITYQGRRLDFTRPYLEKLRDHFNQGAYAQVPFLLADVDNRHTMDPERFRGQVKGFELADDGLDAVIELTDDGAKVVEENPKLAVSARIVQDGGESGPRSVPAIQHVLGTLDPRVVGMRDWELITDLSVCHDPLQVVDLTTALYDGDHKAVDTKITEDHLPKFQALPADKQAEILKLVNGDTKVEPADDKKDEPKPSLLDRLLGRAPGTGDKDADKEFTDLLAGNTPPAPDTKLEPAPAETDPVVANLSGEAKAAVDLANSNAAAANDRAQRIEAELATERFKARRKELVNAGVPPAAVDLAQPILEKGDDTVIDLSNGEKTSARDIVTKLLDEFKGTIDLSGPVGSSEQIDDPEAKQARDVAADDSKWGVSA